MVLAARRARNLDRGFEVVSDPQVSEASRRMATRIQLGSVLIGLAFAGVMAALPL